MFNVQDNIFYSVGAVFSFTSVGLFPISLTNELILTCLVLAGHFGNTLFSQENQY